MSAVANGAQLPDDDSRYDALLPLGLEYQFESTANVYFKDARMLELDAYVGDVYGDIIDMEMSILLKLEGIFFLLLLCSIYLIFCSISLICDHFL